MKNTIIFVYNADASVFARVVDYAHKLISPDTYQCSLCKITYGNLGMKQEWKQFIQTLSQTIIFLHKDNFREKYPQLTHISLPAIFVKEDGKIFQLITSEEINKQHTIQELENLVQSKLKR